MSIFPDFDNYFIFDKNILKGQGKNDGNPNLYKMPNEILETVVINWIIKYIYILSPRSDTLSRGGKTDS